MANSKGPATTKSMYNGKHSLLPPKSPFPSIAPSYADYVPTPAIGPKSIPKYREGNSHHQRTSSESHLIDEQPSWLDDLLNEPETPVRRGHRRSSSDSFAYVDAANAAIMDYSAQDEYRLRNLNSVPWGSQDFDTYKDARNASFFADPNSILKHKNRPWESSPNTLALSSGLATARDTFIPQKSVLPCGSRDIDGISSTTTEKQDAVDSGMHDGKAVFERKDSSCAKASSDTDTKRAKQQFAQRSRVRKLQYIAELERNVQALQVEGTEVSAELEFLNQQSLILSMENKALKQRLENLAQEQLIKYLEHEVLEREIGRLRAVYQQQQQPPQQQPVGSHRRTRSRDFLESQFANLSLKNKDSPASRDTLSGGPLHI